MVLDLKYRLVAILFLELLSSLSTSANNTADLKQLVQSFSELNKTDADYLDKLLDVARQTKLVLNTSQAGDNHFDAVNNVVFGSLDIIFRKNCPLPSREKVDLYIRALNAFWLLESHVDEKSLRLWLRFYSNIKKRILKVIISIPYETADSLLTKVEKMGKPTREMFMNIFYDLGSDHRLSVTGLKGCGLEIGNNYHQHIRNGLFLVVEQLGFATMKAQVMAMSCASVTSNGDQKIINKTLKETSKKVDDLLNHMSVWIRTIQDISTEFAKHALGHKPILVGSYNDLAELILDEFQKRGPGRANYQVVVAQEKKNDQYWTVKIHMENTYTYFTHANIDVHVFRHDKGESKRMIEAKKWFQEKESCLLEGLKHNVFAGNTSKVLLYLENACGPLLQAETYRSVILYRNENFLKSSVKIELGQAFSKEYGRNGTNSVDYMENHWYRNARAWKLLFFL